MWVYGRKRKSEQEIQLLQWVGGAGVVCVHVELVGEGRGLKAGGSSERRPFPAARASAYSASSVSVGCVRCEMDNALLSGSDSDSEDSFVTDKEVGVSRAGGAGRGRRPYSPGTDSRSCPAVAGCVFPRAPEARPQCRVRGSEKSRERRGELGRQVGGTRT